MLSVSIVGIGRLGGALAIALSRKGFSVSELFHRSRKTADLVASSLSPAPLLSPFVAIQNIETDIVLITTGDPAISQIADKLLNRLSGRPVILHTSGSLSSDVLKSLTSKGYSTGSIHPLVSVSDPVKGADQFAGAYFCVEGSEEALRIATDIAVALGGLPFSIPTDKKALYHAAAVMASGRLVALIDSSIKMLSECGLEPERSKRILLPLIRSTIENLETQSPADALTGTFARADIDGLNRHLEAFKDRIPSEVKLIYLLLGELSLSLAKQAGADEQLIEKVRERISMAKRIGG